MTPHKHAELIHAWADGAAIEILSKVDGVWHEEECPDWDDAYEYRIKLQDDSNKKEWVELTSDEFTELAGHCVVEIVNAIRAIEAKIKEKNT